MKNGKVAVAREKFNKIGMIAFSGRIMNTKKLDLNSRVLPHSERTSLIIKSCLDVMNELGAGFLESVYKNSLVIALQQKNIAIEVEQPFVVYFRGQKMGFYKADLVVVKTVIVELKCCKALLPEHQAQVINYLQATGIPIGLLVNFGNRRLEYKRLHHPSFYPAAEGDHADPVFCC